MKNNYLFGIIIFLFIGEMNVGLFAQTVRYVKPVAEGIGDGSSWSNASADLSAILASSSFNDEVWIAAGTYTPGDDSSRSATFMVPSGIRLYGGFAGDEASLNERDPEMNQTILSGEIGTEDYQYDNIKHIINIADGFNNIFDGLIIQDAFTYSFFAIKEPVSISGNYSFVPAPTFGLKTYSISAEIQQAYPLDACDTVEDLSEKIALIQRGTCTFVSKALMAQNAGAVAVVIFNNVEGDIPLMAGTDPNIIIPVIAISQADGQSILTELNAGHTVLAEMEAGQFGGGMNIYNSNLTINNCIFKKNGSSDGSAIFAYDSYLKIADCQFINNSSTRGTIFYNISAVNIENCYFNGNNSQYAGAIYAANSDNSIKYCAFDSNNVTTTAGAIYCYRGESIIDSCSFIRNNSEFAGAIDVSGDSVFAMINHCYIISNTSRGGGAGLYVQLGKARISNCFIYNNISMSTDSVSGSGGGVQLSQNAEAEIINSVIANNHAGGKEDDGGGAIMVYGGQLLLNNVTIANNSTASLGGAIRIYDSSGAVMINNSILWNNSALDDSADCISNTGGMYMVNYSDLQDEDQLAGEGNMNSDPVFINYNNPLGDDATGMTSDDGLMLQENSPLINMGDPLATSPDFDILGYSRSIPIDMGAYEFHPDETGYVSHSTDDISIYPNPASGVVNLNGCEEASHIMIVNMVGQVIWTGTYDSFPLNIANWVKGIYILHVEKEGAVMIRKLIKE